MNKRCTKTYEVGMGIRERCGRPSRHKGKCGPFRKKMVDQENHRLSGGDAVSFLVPSAGVGRNAYVVGRDRVDQDRVSIQIVGDPFPVGVLPDFLKKGHDHKVAKTQERPGRKEMRKLAAELSIDGWEQMTGDAMWAAILKAQKTTTGKAPSKDKAKTNGHGKVTKAPRGKTKADKGEPVTPSQKAKAEKKSKTKKAKTEKVEKVDRPVAENGNPFRPGSHSFLMTEMFLKGGLRSKMIDTLIKKVELHPWAKKAKNIDPRFEMDKRMLMAIHQLRHKYGFTVVVYGGRGPEKGGFKVFPPGEAVPADWKAKALSINGKRVGEDGTVKPKATKKKVVKGKTARKPASKPKAEKSKPKTTKKASTTKAKASKKSKTKK